MAHGDVAPRNVVKGSDNRFRVIDLEKAHRGGFSIQEEAQHIDSALGTMENEEPVGWEPYGAAPVPMDHWESLGKIFGQS